MNERLSATFGHYAKVHTVLFGQTIFSLASNQPAHLEQYRLIDRRSRILVGFRARGGMVALDFASGPNNRSLAL